MDKIDIYINARFLTQRITGVQRFAIELSKRLKDLNANVRFVAPACIVQSDYAKELCVELVGKHKGHLWEQVDLPKFLRRKGSPLLLNLCNTAPLCYSNNIVTIHDLAFLENPKWFSNFFYLSYRFLIPKIARKAKKVVTVSEFSKSEIVTKIGIEKSKIDVVYNGVDKKFNSSREVSPKNYVLFVGSSDPRKNMGCLLSAVKFFNKGVSLKIVGGGAISFNKNYTTINNSKENVEFCGYVSDEELIELYKNATAFIYPSLYEGFGIPPLEAQAAKIPVVVSDIPVFREVFKESATYCNPINIKSIAEVVNKVVSFTNKEREFIINKGIENLKRFNWDKSAELLNEVIRTK